MTLVRVQIVPRRDGYRLVGVYRSAAGRRVRKVLATGAKKEELPQIILAAALPE